MAVVTTDEVKTILQISDDSKDGFIEQIIPIVEDFVKKFCNDDFLDDEGEEAWPVGIKLPVFKLIAYEMENAAGAQSEKLGDMTTSYGSGYPKALKEAFAPWRKVRFM